MSKRNNPLYILPQGTKTEMAIINVLNILTQDMYDRKVQIIKNQIEKDSQEILSLQSQSVSDNENILDLDFRVSMLEEDK